MIDLKKRTYRYFRKPNGNVTQAYYTDQLLLFNLQSKGYPEIHHCFFKDTATNKAVVAFSDDELLLRQFRGGQYEPLTDGVAAFKPLPKFEEAPPARPKVKAHGRQAVRKAD